MPANTVEAVLKSKYEEGIDKGIEGTRRLMERSFAAMKNSAAAAGAGIEQAFESVAGGLESFRRRMTQAADESDNGFKKMGFAAIAFGTAAVEILLRATKATADFVLELLKESSAAFETRLAFEAVAKSAGVQADVLSKQLKVATEGQISGTILARNAMKVLSAELPITTDQYVKLVANVFSLADVQGKDAVAAQDALTTAIIKGNSRGLGPALGVHIAVKDAVSDMAAAMDVSAGKLRDNAKFSAFYAEALDATSRAVARQGAAHKSFDDILVQATKTSTSLVGTWGVAIQRSEVLQALFFKMSEAMLGISFSTAQTNQAALATNEILISLIRGFAGLIDLVALFGPLWESIWSGGKALLAAFANVFFGVSAAIVNFIGRWIQVFSLLPGAVGDSLKQTAALLGAFEDDLRVIAGAAHNAFNDSFDGFGAGTLRLEGLSASSKALAAELEKVRKGVVGASGGLQKLSADAHQAAGDQKELNEQLKAYREMLFTLHQAVADADAKELAELAKRGTEIIRLDKLSIQQRKELLDASWAAFVKQRADRAREEREARETEEAQRLQSVKSLGQQLQAAAADGYRKAELQLQESWERIDSITKRGSEDWLRLRVLANNVYLAEIDKLHQEEQKKAEEEARKLIEIQKKQIADEISLAHTLAQAVETARAGKLDSVVGRDALAQIPNSMAAIKTKLEELHRAKTFSAEQIDDIIRLREALDKLNRLNLTPFQKALQLLKDNMQQIGAQATQAWGKFWADMVSGTDGAGKKFLAALINIAAQQLEIQAIQQTSEAIVSAAALDFAGAARHAAAAAALGALGGVLQGFASSLSNSSSNSSSAPASAPSGSGASQSSTPTQVINVGAPGRSQAPVTARQTEHTVVLEIRPQDAYIVKTVKANVRGNGELRTVVKK